MRLICALSELPEFIRRSFGIVLVQIPAVARFFTGIKVVNELIPLLIFSVICGICKGQQRAKPNKYRHFAQTVYSFYSLTAVIYFSIEYVQPFTHRKIYFGNAVVSNVAAV